MAGAFDLSGFNYGYGTAPNVPGMGVMGAGASQPMAAAYQDVATTGAITGTGAKMPGAQGPGMTDQLGFNIPTLDLALGGIKTIGNLWAAFQAQKMAKEQFAFQKDITNTNLSNQIMAYNTTLEDRIRSRAGTEQGQAGGLQPGQAAGYIRDHQMTRQPRGA